MADIREMGRSLSVNEFALQPNQTQFTVRGNPRLSGAISPIERWPDRNYAPHPLDYLCVVTPTRFQIVAGLNGYTAQDVHVDLTRGCVLILIARDDNSASADMGEYYCEVPLPPDVKANVARVEIEGDFVTVSLDRRQASLVRRVVAGMARLKNGSALLLGNGRAIRLFDEG